MTQSDYIAIGSAVVALCALFVSVWQGYLSRHHNHVSVQPRLEVVVAIAIDGVLTLELKNGGLGPAILRELFFEYDGDKHMVIEKDDYVSLAKFLLLHATWNQFNLQTYLHDNHTHVLPGESVQLLKLTLEEPSNSAKSSVQDQLALVSIHVRYSCVYGLRYSLYKRSIVGAA